MLFSFFLLCTWYWGIISMLCHKKKKVLEWEHQLLTLLTKGLFKETAIWERDFKTLNMTRKIQFSLYSTFFLSIDNLQSIDCSHRHSFDFPSSAWRAVFFFFFVRTQISPEYRLFSKAKAWDFKCYVYHWIPNKTDGNLIEGWRTLCGLRRTSPNSILLPSPKPLNPLQMLLFH